MGNKASRKGAPAPKKKEQPLEDDDVNTMKILLLGSHNQGKTTLFRQLNFLYSLPASQEEMKLKLAQFLVHSMKSVLKHIPKELISENSPETKSNTLESVEFISKADPGPSCSLEDVYTHIQILWADEVVKKAFATMKEKKEEYSENMDYFFDEVVTEPSHDDYLKACAATTGVAQTKFEFDSMRFLISDVGGLRSERKKWIHMFDDVSAVVFVIALNSYPRSGKEGVESSIQDSLDIFKEYAYFKGGIAKMLLFTKKDLFENELDANPFTQTFSDFTSVGTTGAVNPDDAMRFLADKFVALGDADESYYFNYVNTFEKDDIKRFMQDARNVILKKKLKAAG
jgi:guanine nucleotide-binding protein G(i) subunit alpha